MHPHQGVQVMITPFVKLKGAGVQKFAAFRYQHWYWRVTGPTKEPSNEIAGPGGPPTNDVPPAFSLVPRLTWNGLLTQRMPSPNRTDGFVVPWK